MQKTLLVKLVEEYYGAGKSERVYGRLAEEMRLVGRSTWMPLWRCVAALRQEFGPENVLVLGSTNDSLLACLLGATSVNPLPPHYRCNNCHYTTFNCDHYEDGWDMPDAVCPACGGSMEGDGHRLSSRSLAMRLPDISLRVPNEMRQLVTDFIPDYWQCMDEDGTFTVEPYSDEEMTALRLTLSTYSPWLRSHMSMPLPNTSAEMSQPVSSVLITCAVGSLSSTASSDGPV